MDVVFLDANILFSAAYRPKAAMRDLWRLKSVELISSGYAIEEARRNLTDQRQRSDLVKLLRKVRIVPEAAPQSVGAEGLDLAQKDRPIARAASAAGATHLLTGDTSHFGRHFGKTLLGVKVLRPAEYLGEKAAD